MMGNSEIIRGRLGSVARAINVPDADPNHQGVANVNAIFTWVRLLSACRSASKSIRSPRVFVWLPE